MIEGDGVSRGHGSSDDVGRGFVGVEVGRGELRHRLMAWIPTRWVMDSWQR